MYSQYKSKDKIPIGHQSDCPIGLLFTHTTSTSVCTCDKICINNSQGIPKFNPLGTDFIVKEVNEIHTVLPLGLL